MVTAVGYQIWHRVRLVENTVRAGLDSRRAPYLSNERNESGQGQRRNCESNLGMMAYASYRRLEVDQEIRLSNLIDGYIFEVDWRLCQGGDRVVFGPRQATS